MASRKKNKNKGRGKAKRSSAKRGSKTMKLVAHVGFDFDNYMRARGFAMRARKRLKTKMMPEIRKIETKKGKVYAVIFPDSKVRVDKRTIKKLAAR